MARARTVSRGTLCLVRSCQPTFRSLIPSTFKAEEVATFGSDVPMARAGEPAEVAPCYVFLASSDSSYITGQVLHPNGGEIVNG